MIGALAACLPTGLAVVVAFWAALDSLLDYRLLGVAVPCLSTVSGATSLA